MSELAVRADRTSALGDVLAGILDRRGITPKKLGGEFTNDGIPVLSAMNIVNGRIDRARQERYVTEEVAQRWMSTWLKAGDILMTSEAPLGSTVLLMTNLQACLGQRLFTLRPNQQLILPEYLYAWLSSAAGQAALEERSTGTTVKGIRQTELVKVELPVPEISAQRAFLVGWRTLQASRSAVDRRIQAVTSLRNSLLTDVFGGN